MSLDWRILRVEEGRGFVSKRILTKILVRQTLVLGACHVIHYGNFSRVLTMNEIFTNINPNDN